MSLINQITVAAIFGLLASRLPSQELGLNEPIQLEPVSLTVGEVISGALEPAPEVAPRSASTSSIADLSFSGGGARLEGLAVGRVIFEIFDAKGRIVARQPVTVNSVMAALQLSYAGSSKSTEAPPLVSKARTSSFSAAEGLVEVSRPRASGHPDGEAVQESQSSRQVMTKADEFIELEAQSSGVALSNGPQLNSPEASSQNGPSGDHKVVSVASPKSRLLKTEPKARTDRVAGVVRSGQPFRLELKSKSLARPKPDVSIKSLNMAADKKSARVSSVPNLELK